MLRYKDKQKERFKRLMKKIYCENPRGREVEYIMDMDQDFLQVKLKASFKEIFKSGTGGNLNNNISRSLAIGAFIERRVTLARAAELAETSLVEFIDILSKYNIPWMEYREETFKEDQETLEKIRDSINNS